MRRNAGPGGHTAEGRIRLTRLHRAVEFVPGINSNSNATTARRADRECLMKSILSVAVLLGLLASLPSPGLAQSDTAAAGSQDAAPGQPTTPPLPARAPDPPGFEDGLLAYHRGDPAVAFKIWEPLAQRGHPAAQYSLGVLYQQGEGVLRDLRLAAHWYRRAAQRGDPDAQLNLGLLYARGEGVRQDYVEAYKWFSLAFLAYAPGEYRDIAYRNRENAAAAMTQAQIKRAEKLVEEWRVQAP